jgi:outer membrane receptor for ferric coprogen and ferric-rhodotorulic acid
MPWLQAMSPFAVSPVIQKDRFIGASSKGQFFMAQPIALATTAPFPPSALTRAACRLLRRPVQTALLGLMLGAAAAACAQTGQATPASQAAREYDIPAGSLSQALSRLAGESGVTLSADPHLTQGLHSPGLKGRFELSGGFAQLLLGTGLQAVQAGQGVYVLRKSAASPAVTPAAGGAPSALPEVRVAARAEHSLATEETGAYTASAVSLGKTAQSLREIPQSVSVVTRQMLEDQNIQSLDDAMRTLAGVTVEPGSTGGNHGNFYLRGYAGFGMAMYDRIELLRGPAGLFQGAGDPGGSINLVRKRPKAQAEFSTQFSAGSWQRYYAEADMTGPLSSDGRVRGRLVTAYQDQHSFVDHVYSRKPLVYGVVEVDLAPSTTLTAGGSHQQYKGRPAFGLPALPNGQLLDIPRSSYLDPIWNHITERNTEYFAELQHRLDNGGHIRLNAMYREQDEPSRLFGWSDCAADPATGDSCLISWAYRSHWKTLGLDGSLSTPFNAFGSTRNELTVGADYRKLHKNFQYGGGDDAPINIHHPDNNIPLPTGYSFSNGNDNRTEQWGLYARTNLRPMDRLLVSLGGRMTWWQNHAINRNAYFNQFSEADNRVNGKFTPYAGLVLDLNDQLSAYASYTRIFAPQTTTDADGNTLRPRVGRQYEAGLKGEWLDGQLHARTAIFRMEDSNRAMTDPANPLFSVAAGKMRSQGVEAEVGGRIAPGWNVSAGYAYTQTRTLEGTPDQKAQLYTFIAPRHSFNLWTRYQFGPGTLEGFSLGGGLRSVSRMYRLNGDVKFSQGPVTTAALQFGYRINRHVDATLTINNLFDKVYYQRVWAAYGSNYFGEPRNVMLTVRGRF